MDRVKLGKITAPHGVKGEVRVFPYTDEQTRFSAIKELWVNDTPAKIERVSYQKNMVIIKLNISSDRNTAETLRDKELFLDRENLWDVPQDTYFVQDLLGCKCIDEQGRVLGTLCEVIQNPAQDIYLIKDEKEKDHMVPAVKEFIKKVDTDNRIVCIHLIEGLFD